MGKYLSDSAVSCLKRLNSLCKENDTNCFDPFAFNRKDLEELESRGIVELEEQGIIEIGIYHPEALS